LFLLSSFQESDQIHPVTLSKAFPDKFRAGALSGILFLAVGRPSREYPKLRDDVLKSVLRDLWRFESLLVEWRGSDHVTMNYEQGKVCYGTYSVIQVH
jgi:hypothetical protein